ncbi:MAG: MYXO-CTERM sorting domain-containing protein, partial [Sandaracinaceae bacterium]
ANAGETDEALLTLINDGEAELSVTLGEPEGPFSTETETVVLAPSSSQRVPVRFSPEAGGEFSTVLLVSSNDPDEPLVTVALSGNAAGVPLGDGGMPLDGGTAPPTDGGCGCRVGAPSPSPAPAFLALLALGWGARRRRR